MAALNKILRRSLFQIPLQTATLLLTFLLPVRACLPTTRKCTDPEPQPSAYKPGPSDLLPSNLYHVPQPQ